MKYVMLIHQGTTPTPRRPEAWAALSPRRAEAVYADYQASTRRPASRPACGMAAPETATTVRVAGRPDAHHRRPVRRARRRRSAATCIFEADDLDAAIELASRIPAARLGGAIEVRPIEEW